MLRYALLRQDFALNCCARRFFPSLCSSLLRFIFPCYAFPCCAVFRYALLCFAPLSFAMPCYAMTCICVAMLGYAWLCDALQCFPLLCFDFGPSPSPGRAGKCEKFTQFMQQCPESQIPLKHALFDSLCGGGPRPGPKS